MGWPQVIVIALFSLSAGVALTQHGKPRKGNVSFPSWVVAAGIHGGLLYWGGFFG